MGLEQSLENIIARFDEMGDIADDAVARLDAHVASSIANWPAVNLLKNTAATATDLGGDLTSPLTFFARDGSPTTFSQRVLVPADPDVPAELLPFAQAPVISPVYNVIEVTLSANGGVGTFSLLSSGVSRGPRTGGVLAAFAPAAGLQFCGVDLTAGQALEGLREHRSDFHNMGLLGGSVVGDNQKLFIVGPWLAAGDVTGPPLQLHDGERHHVADEL